MDDLGEFAGGAAPAARFDFKDVMAGPVDSPDPFGVGAHAAGFVAGGASGQVNYEYYEGLFDSLPDFSMLTPVTVGVSGNFDEASNVFIEIFFIFFFNTILYFFRQPKQRLIKVINMSSFLRRNSNRFILRERRFYLLNI